MAHNFTVCLTDEETARVKDLLHPYGATVGGFCTSIVRDYLRLTPEQLHVVRRQIRELGTQNKTAPTAKAGRNHR